MNAWEIFLQIATWVGLMLLLVLIFFIAWVILNAIYHEIAKMIRKGRDDLDRYLGEARALSAQLPDEQFRAGWLAGARWGWGYFHRVKPTKK